MNRPKEQKLLAQAQPETLGVRAEDVLPEHMLLRFLSNCGVVDKDKPVDTNFAMRVAAMIAASEAFEEQNGQTSNAAVRDDNEGDVDAEAGYPEEEAMTSELDPSNDPSEPLDDVQLEEAATIAAEATEGLAAMGEPIPQPSERDEDSVAIDVGELLGDTATEAEDDAVDAQSTNNEQATITPDEEEIGALMADMVQPTDTDEQQRLQVAFAEEPTAEEPAPEETSTEELVAEEQAIEESVAADQAAAAPPQAVEVATAEEAAEPTDEPEAVVDTAPEEAVAEEQPTETANTETNVVAGTTQEAAEDATEEEPRADAADSEPDMVSVEAPAVAVPEAENAADVEVAAEAATDTVIESPTTDEPLAEGALAAPEQVAEEEPTVIPEPQAEEPAAPAATTEEATPAGDPTTEEFALTNGTMDKVQDFLSELKGALVTMAQRTPEPAPEPPPAPAPIDVAPLMQAMQEGFEKSAHQAEQANTAVASMSEHMAQLGTQLEGGMGKIAGSIGAQPLATPAPAGAAAPDFVEDKATSQAVVLGAVSLIVLGWSIVFWIKTGSPKLALGTLVGANVIACCLLLSRGTRK